MDPQDTSQQVGMVGACRGSLRSGCLIPVCCYLCKSRYDMNKPFRHRDFLEEVISIESSAPQSWFKKPELLAIRRISGMRTSPLAHILHRGKTWDPLSMWRGCQNVTMHGTQVRDKIISVSISSARATRADIWVSGTWLHLRGWLALLLAAGRENNLPPPHLLLHRDPATFDSAGLLRRDRTFATVRFYVSVCQLRLLWSVFQQPLLKCMHAQFFWLFQESQRTLDLCKLWEQQGLSIFIQQQDWVLGSCRDTP